MNIFEIEKANAILNTVFNAMNMELEYLRYEIDLWKLEIIEVKEDMYQMEHNPYYVRKNKK